MSQFTPKYFVKKFEAIPDDQWCTGTLSEGDNRFCALGHLGLRDYYDEPTDEVRAITAMFPPCAPRHDYWSGVAELNDGDPKDGMTPKQRVLGGLYAKLRTSATIKDA
jgi:hypothetical protein